MEISELCREATRAAQRVVGPPGVTAGCWLRRGGRECLRKGPWDRECRGSGAGAECEVTRSGGRVGLSGVGRGGPVVIGPRGRDSHFEQLVFVRCGEGISFRVGVEVRRLGGVLLGIRRTGMTGFPDAPKGDVRGAETRPSEAPGREVDGGGERARAPSCSSASCATGPRRPPARPTDAPGRQKSALAAQAWCKTVRKGRSPKHRT